MDERSKPAETRDPRVEAAIRDYLERVDRGEAVNREEFISRHAEIADALRSFFGAEEPLRKMAVTKISEQSAGISTRSIAAQGQETVPPESQPDRRPGTTGSGLAGQFGRYQIIRALGRGAMGAVYLAQDTQLKRNVAIKTPHFEDDPTGELLKRFYREAEAAATLLNANICPVYDVGEIDGKHFISMAYIEGRPLSDLIRSDKPQNERHIVIAVHKLARALQQAHDHGIVHRDLKPANIMVNKQGEPVIMDFGLARKRRAEGEASLTHSGMLLGSPAYMSPEQIEGDPESVGPASDQYSLGVVLYEMLTRQLPFRGSVVNVLAQILTKDLTRPSELRPGLDPRIEVVCLRMMAKKASNRFPSMKAVAEELYAILKSPAAEPVAAEKAPTASRSSAAPAPSRGDAGTSQIRKSVKQKALTESDMTSLEELVRKCLRRRDYDQVIQIIERIPEERRNAELLTLLEMARGKADEIAFLICEIDEAERLNDAQTALKKAEDLLKIKPGHHRAREIQEKFSGYGEGGAARIGPLHQFTRPWSEGGWIPWSVLAFGLAVFGVMTGVIVIYLGRTAVVIDIKDPGVEVAVKGTTLTVTGPDKQSVTRVSDVGLAQFKNRKNLTFLQLWSTQATDAGMAYFKDCKNLTHLHVGGTQVSDAGLAYFKNCKKLTYLHLGSTHVTDAGLALFKDCKGITELYLFNNQLSDAGLAYFKHCNRVETLHLSSTPVSDAGLAHFNDCKNLTTLYLDNTELTDATLEWLGGLRKLEYVNVKKTNITEAGVKKLAAARPRCKIEWDGGAIGPKADVATANAPSADGILNSPTDPDRRAAEWVLSVGGTIKIDESGKERDIKPGGDLPHGTFELTEVRLHGNPKVTDAGLACFKDCKSVNYLGLWDSQVSDAGLAYFKDCESLKDLLLWGTQVSDAGLAYFKDCKNLTSLSLSGPQVTNAGLAYFKDRKNLTWLSLSGLPQVTDAGLAHFKDRKNLAYLRLVGPQVSDVGLTYFKDCKNLAVLQLVDTQVSDVGLAYFKGCKYVTVLLLSGTHVTDAGLAHFKNCKKLESLRLDDTHVTDASLERLAGFRQLTSVFVKKTNVTEAGVKKLAAARPRCKIEWDGGVTR